MFGNRLSCTSLFLQQRAASLSFLFCHPGWVHFTVWHLPLHILHNLPVPTPRDEWCNPFVSVIMTVVCKRKMICNFPHPLLPFHNVNRARRSGYKVTGPMQQSGIPSRTFGEHFYSASTSSGFRLRFPSSQLCMKTFLKGIYRKHSSVVVLLLWPLSSYPNEIVWRRFVTSGTCEAYTASYHARMGGVRSPFWGLWCWVADIPLQRKFCVGRQITRIKIRRFLALCVFFVSEECFTVDFPKFEVPRCNNCYRGNINFWEYLDVN